MPRAWKCRGCGIQRPTLAELIDPIARFCKNCGGFWNFKNVNVVDDEDGEASKLIEGESIALQDAINIEAKQPEIVRIESGIVGLDKVLGGGVVPGSVILVTGDPGAGKSSLLIQACQHYARRRKRCLYITGEESVAQLAFRYKRFGRFPTRMQALHATDIDHMHSQIEDVKPDIAVVDSIQCIEIDDDLEAGSATSIKIAINEFRKFAKETGTVVFIIGHVTKGGAISGPRALEHMVDVAIHLAGNEQNPRRRLECSGKNRFGRTPVRADFEMTENGLADRSEDVEAPKVELVSIPLDTKNGDRSENP